MQTSIIIARLLGPLFATTGARFALVTPGGFITYKGYAPSAPEIKP